MSFTWTGAGLIVVVVLTHVAERFSLFPWMGWGLPNSPGHYLDLLSAIGGVALIGMGLARRMWLRGSRRPRESS